MKSVLLFVMAAAVSMATVLWHRSAFAQMCNTNCKTMVCWQVCGTCDWNCRKVKIGVGICGITTVPHHVEAGGGSCGPMTVYLQIQKCQFCDPECSDIPGEADGCDGLCSDEF